MGHVVTFNKVAALLSARGIEIVAAYAPLANIDRAHLAISNISAGARFQGAVERAME